MRGEGVKVEWASLDRWSCVSRARSSGGWFCGKCCQGREADHGEGPRPHADREVKSRQLPCRGRRWFGWARRRAQNPEQRLEKELSHKDLVQDFRERRQVRNGTEGIVVAGVGDIGTESQQIQRAWTTPVLTEWDDGRSVWDWSWETGFYRSCWARIALVDEIRNFGLSKELGHRGPVGRCGGFRWGAERRAWTQGAQRSGKGKCQGGRLPEGKVSKIWVSLHVISRHPCPDMAFQIGCRSDAYCLGIVSVPAKNNITNHM